MRERKSKEAATADKEQEEVKGEAAAVPRINTARAAYRPPLEQRRRVPDQRRRRDARVCVCVRAYGRALTVRIRVRVRVYVGARQAEYPGGGTGVPSPSCWSAQTTPEKAPGPRSTDNRGRTPPQRTRHAAAPTTHAHTARTH